MAEPSTWQRHTRTWWTRGCGVFTLWAGDGLWEVAHGGEMVTSGRVASLATTDVPTSIAAAKADAEAALRKLLTDALTALDGLAGAPAGCVEPQLYDERVDDVCRGCGLPFCECPREEQTP